MSIKARSYEGKRKNRKVSKNEKTLIWDSFVHEKKSTKEIGVLLNMNESIIESVLFNNNKPFKNFDNRGVCAFGKKTAYWKDEEELAESFDPKYSFEDIDEKELAWFRLASGQTEIIRSKFK